MAEYLRLKWGTLKGWNLETEASLAAAREYEQIGTHSMSAMSQRDTPEQKQALCKLIDAIDGPITNDWSGERLSKDEAKRYVMEYSA
jgi:hypothetical protein